MPSVPDYDPLTLASQPSKDETEDQRMHREREEAHARKVSLDIDDQLKQDRTALKKRQNAVRVLLLGQSESGKSTTIKNFQIKYSYDAWAQERKQWKTVVHLNLVRSVTLILQVLGKEMVIANPKAPVRATRPSTSQSPYNAGDSDDEFDTSPSTFSFTEKHKLLQLRLQPLFRIRKDLETSLGSEAIDEHDPFEKTGAAPFLDQEAAAINPRRPKEFFVTSQQGWRGALDRVRTSGSASKGTRKDIEDAVEVIAGCRDDIKHLWADDVVRSILEKHDIRLEHSSGFFLNDVDRVVARDYEPSDDDVVRARLRTMGIQEYSFSYANNGIWGEWLLFDVGGARSSRGAWFPYFDDIDSIIFLAPISCFDQRLAEDRTVNRLEDSFLLWQSICSSKLLQNVQMIIFLNKFDLLAEKLKSGVKFGKYVVNYGNRANDAETVSKYIKQQFNNIMKETSPKRVFYSHLTSVIDTKEMSSTIGAVYDGIIRQTLKKSQFI